MISIEKMLKCNKKQAVSMIFLETLLGSCKKTSLLNDAELTVIVCHGLDF